MSLDETRPFKPLRIAVLTLSDTRGPENDTSGDLLAERLQTAGHVLAARHLMRDDRAGLEAFLRVWVENPEIDVILTTGGTGLTGRDVTVEAHRALYEKEIDGFSTVFHIVSLKSIGVSTLQSRACAGVAKGTYMFALPGSTGACRDAWDEILVKQLDSRWKPCNFAQIFGRLTET